MNDETKIAEVLRAENELAMSEADVPPSAVVWWRIQRRLRNEATNAAMRAATAVQALTVIAAIVVISGIVSALAPQIDWAAIMRMTTLLTGGTIACLTLAPLAIYFVLRPE